MRKTSSRFTADLLRKLETERMLRIRAGDEHRDIGIWVVVVDDRVFVRSWTAKAGGWYRTFLDDPRGAITVDGEEIPILAKPVRAERLRDGVDEAYARKYTTKASLPYVKGLRTKKRRDTTTELVPAE